MMYGYESISRTANDPEEQLDRGPHYLAVPACQNI